jgi:hypothetical protein
LKAKGIDAEADYAAISGPKSAPVDINQMYKDDEPAAAPASVSEGLSKFLSIVRKNDVGILNEGANPHKVSLPVQMAMQHYQQPSDTPARTVGRTSTFGKYFHKVEAEVNETAAEEYTQKRQMINQYAAVIAERVLMKESLDEACWKDYKQVGTKKKGRKMVPNCVPKESVSEDNVPTDPNKLTASMLMGGEYKELDLTPLIAKNNWVGTPKQVINQADKWLSDFLRQRGNMYSNLKIKYKGLTMTSSKIGDVDEPDPEFESIAEAPIAMDPNEPNNPTIHGHQKANAMTLKGRIASARAQLKELAQLADRDDLLAWEEICKKAKGGMFMGLEQNLEQIRHGIEELAAKRRKGGTASRGIDKHIGETVNPTIKPATPKAIKPKAKTSTCRTGQTQTGMQTKDGKLVPKCSVTKK